MRSAANRNERRGVPLVFVVFVLAAAIRILFWLATADRNLAHAAAFRGDALLFLDYARWLKGGPLFELGLPIHPPGAAWLVAAVWDGSTAGILYLRLAWALLGAAGVALLSLAAAHSFGSAVGWMAGLFMATSTALILLSSSVGPDVPYLALVGVCLLLLPSATRSWTALVAVSVLHAFACLLRVEHALFYAALLVWGLARKSQPPLRVAASIAVFLLTLVPWHVAGWQRIDRFNTEPPNDASSRMASAMLTSAGSPPWSDGAWEEAERLPAFARPTAMAFVAFTAAYRGEHAVSEASFRVLDEAFGYRPRPLKARPFVSLYGPLNFALANDPRGSGGFSRARLQDPPPLRPSAAAFPPQLVAGLPPPDLSLVYPPHLALVNDGYRIGLDTIRSEPVAFGDLLLRKLRNFAAGAGLGITGYGFPAGIGGVRRAVDLATPQGGTAFGIWLSLLTVGCMLGLAHTWREPALHPWLLFAASKLVVTAAFFGYARQGAQVVPVIAVLIALAVRRLAPSLTQGRISRLAVVGFMAVCLAAEAIRFLRPPTLLLDGQPILVGTPAPGDDHLDHAFQAR